MLVTEIIHPEMQADEDFEKLKLVFVGTKEEAEAHVKEKDGEAYDIRYEYVEHELLPV